MFIRLFFVLVVSFVSVFANIQDFELLADDVKREANIITANKNVLVYSKEYTMSADRAVYNQDSRVLELFGNVNLMRGKEEVSRCNYAKIDLNSKDSSYEALFLMNKGMEVWMQNDESKSNSKYYETRGSIVSSCNVQNPDWKIKFSSGKLNKESKYLHLYNPVLYIHDIPMFYLPYFGFSTDTRRRTGLLSPDLGYNKNGGFFYRQPIYIAEYNSWDLQLDPQIRTLRGSGLYTVFRFADSPYSGGSIGFGTFSDKDSYRQKQISQNSNRLPLKNKTHKGVEVKYERSRLVKHLIDSDLQEGLWLDATKLNDIDFINLKSRSGDNSEENSLVTSKLNYFISSDKHYFGSYARYYIDTAKVGNVNENKDTLQEYPSFQYHKYTDSLLLPNIIYSVDLYSRNYTRKIGVEATQHEFSLPVSAHILFLQDYLTFSYHNHLYATQINYSNKMYRPTGAEDNSASYIENSHKFSLHTDIAKAYESFYHSLNLGIDYITRGYNNGELPDDYETIEYDQNTYVYDMSGNKYQSFINSPYTKDEVAARLTQYFFNQDGRKLLRHTISQGYYTKDSRYSNLKNIIGFYPMTNLSFYNKLEYSHKHKYIEKIQTGANHDNRYFGLGLWHTYEKKSEQEVQNFISGTGSINLQYNYKLLGRLQYDLQRAYTKDWRLGIAHKRKCWNYSILYEEKIEPTSTSGGSASKKSKGVYLMVNFYPMGGIHYDFSLGESYEEGR
ncbi:LPS-assembly protein LptD [Campylobacter sp. RM16192]|uniref:LPS-assembly protein LptD n=1 Tax=Campylobacter sp. RM16192 TaxID=1660080 RepID=UPI001452115C|nr:LPS-assembly protein LptD [Campylobacter sp. RM16192]QCD53041.1 putative lipooligosaccharide transport system, OM component (LptD family) [Campylobacter sp. RM16192]